MNGIVRFSTNRYWVYAGLRLVGLQVVAFAACPIIAIWPFQAPVARVGGNNSYAVAPQE